ncbi:hypothetical protein PROSTU_04484 [Providencia stuartii ATCC 25827]|uniref:Uncharacterized protein n=1 Tax=Providencia stuartii ATCC 25827 TaxID=471874 RepID=A0AA87CS57_PROST|nr:hypothetical protein PROSTU_04484 [Providencia stuartii ATCC 25827]
MAFLRLEKIKFNLLLCGSGLTVRGRCEHHTPLQFYCFWQIQSPVLLVLFT